MLPPRVSIQGASALDTIFDARKQTVNIFEIGVQVIDPLEPDYDWIHTFIDSITLRGARDVSPSTGQRGAGVRIWGEPSVEATISNCFFTNNLVGVGMWVDDPSFIHYPRIINNTFAWNQVGVYNGSNVAAHEATGQNMPMLINNIFDVSTPIPYQALGYLAGISSFEGIDSSDRTVMSIPNGNPMLDFNAYEVPPGGQGVPRQNIGDLGATPYAWPRTQSRNTGQTYTPRVNLFNFTQTPTTYGAYATQRGALYINDIFRMDASIPMIAIHDFRLAPTAIRGDNLVRSVHPLIGQGLDLGYANGVPVYVGLITMVNGTFSQYAPGLPPDAEDLVVLNCWDFDADGFGNPRVSDRRHGPQPGQWGRVDIGADESSEVTISGYIESTRTFSRPHSGVAPNTAGLVGGSSVYFFNVYFAQGSNNQYWRYESNFPSDLVYTTPHQRPTGTEWYNQIITNPYGTGSNYTNGGFDNRAIPPAVPRPRRNEWVTNALYNRPEFMRNLFCDISPHLHWDFPPGYTLGVLDPSKTYPHWGEYIRFATVVPINPPYPLYDDIFHSNPWFEGTDSGKSKYDNPQLFYDPNTSNTWPRTSIVKPPLTVPQFTWATGDKSYLLSNQNHAVWLFEWPYNPNPTWTYTVNNYGWGGPDSPPFQYPWHGIRFNCQLLDPNNSYWPPLRVTNNLQTFLVVEGLPGIEMGLNSSTGKKGSPSQITSYSHPDRDIYPGSKIYKPLMKAFREFLRQKGAGR